jgi:glutamate N-acetyltransferase / amino-acid N-acetyltransferase
MMPTIMCPGFKAAGIAAGIKANGNPDMGLIVSDTPAAAAGVFTRNQIKAAPVLLDMERIQSGEARAIVVNAGNANCCTGEQGMADARRTAALFASALGISENLVMVSSTGVIGKAMPMEKVAAAVPGLVSGLSENGLMAVATAFMTTDTVPKAISLQGEINGKIFTLTGMIKGAGMIRPDVATMLCYLLTDAAVSPLFLKTALKVAADRSFNRASIDGDTSTNDTVFLLANGVSGIRIEAPAEKEIFQNVLNDLCLRLTRAMVRDGEGVSKLVEIVVKGALTDADAFRVADTVGHSPLVKTAIFGEDANWGRIVGAAGRAGVPIEPEKIDIFLNDCQLLLKSRWCGAEAEAEATEVMRTSEFVIVIDLNMGHGTASLITCDFSVDYVKINANYRT